MALHYVLDGYNLLYAMTEMPAGTWQDKRAALLAHLKKLQPQGKNPVTVVFDSREGPGSRSVENGITVVYTSGETADDKIIAMVRLSQNPRVMVVVSNDKGIRHLLKSTGAQFMSADEFLRKSKRAKSADAQEPVEDPTITDELRKEWL